MDDNYYLLLFIGIAVVLILLIVKGLSNSKKKKHNKSKMHSIVCPFCYREYSPKEVRFLFPNFNREGISQFISADDNPSSEGAIATKRLLESKGLYARINANDGFPVECELFTKKEHHSMGRSQVRVCKHYDCNQILSAEAGSYRADNGLFVIGLKSSGKTVYITTAIERLMSCLPASFGCSFRAYNGDVSDEFRKNYYDIIYENKKLPPATINASQLTYEVINKSKLKTVGITFSDMKGEIANNVKQVLESGVSKVIEHSNYFLLTIDLLDIADNSNNLMKTVDIVNQVLSLATQLESRKKNQYLAVVLTKSDSLIGFDKTAKHSEIFRRDNEIVSPIYKPVKFQKQAFINERNQINQWLKNYLNYRYPQITMAVESAFLANNVNYFAVSALGQEPVNGKLTADVMPLRVEEPVIWLLSNSGVLDWRES